VARGYGQVTKLVGSYPSVSKLILTWPVTPTGGIAPKQNTNDLSYLCMYTGKFVQEVTCMSDQPGCPGSSKQALYVYLLPRGGPVANLVNGFPSRDVPVSG